MEKKNCSDMSNNDIKLYIQSLENEFNSKKQIIKEICDELIEIEDEYKKAVNELSLRKNVF